MIAGTVKIGSVALLLVLVVALLAATGPWAPSGATTAVRRTADAIAYWIPRDDGGCTFGVKTWITDLSHDFLRPCPKDPEDSASIWDLLDDLWNVYAHLIQEESHIVSREALLALLKIFASP